MMAWEQHSISIYAFRLKDTSFGIFKGISLSYNEDMSFLRNWIEKLKYMQKFPFTLLPADVQTEEMRPYKEGWSWEPVQFSFSLVAQSSPILCHPMNCSIPGLPVHHQLPEFTQTHVNWVSDAIQPSHPLSSPSPPDPDPSQHQSLFQWVNSSHEVAKVLEFQLQHHSFQWTPRTDLL